MRRPLCVKHACGHVGRYVTDIESPDVLRRMEKVLAAGPCDACRGGWRPGGVPGVRRKEGEP